MVGYARTLAGHYIGGQDHDTGGLRGDYRLVDLDRQADFLVLVLVNVDDEPPAFLFYAGCLQSRTGKSNDVDGEGTCNATLVEDTHGVVVADPAVGQHHGERIALMLRADLDCAASGQRIQHNAANHNDDRGVHYGARPDQPIDRRSSGEPELSVDIGVVGDQAGRPVDLPHDVVASINAQATLDAAQLNSVANVAPGRADIDALMTVDA